MPKVVWEKVISPLLKPMIMRFISVRFVLTISILINSQPILQLFSPKKRGEKKKEKTWAFVGKHFAVLVYMVTWFLVNPGVTGCFCIFSVTQTHPGDPAGVDQLFASPASLNCKQQLTSTDFLHVTFLPAKSTKIRSVPDYPLMWNLPFHTWNCNFNVIFLYSIWISGEICISKRAVCMWLAVDQNFYMW